ncbi:efflux RND transporter periplasmic adaptor subunit [Kordiimonas pumila]|uniref:efflux RND transporter periplasmic adaptor subunit n=1 Tax=Kordiimonas pumila TaxID=2161677 RepID=UPI00188338CC
MLTDVKKDDEGDKVRPVSVVTEHASERSFSDIVQAIGTAKADESVTLTSTVADVIVSVHFQDGDIVKKGDLLVQLESAEEEAQFQEADANLRQAEKQYDRINDLVKTGNASNATLDSEKRGLQEARYRVAAAKARLDDLYITAPFDGLLGLREVSEGSYLSTSTKITTIDAIDTIKLDFYVPERFVATLASGQSVEATVEAYPGKIFKGIVKTVDSRIDPATRSVLVRAEIDNSQHTLRPGMLMMVEVTSRSWNALSISEEGIVPANNKNYVFVIEDGIAVRREVTTGIRRPGYVEITSGVTAGDKVVVQGAFRLGRIGQPVREVEQKRAPINGDKS